MYSCFDTKYRRQKRQKRISTTVPESETTDDVIFNVPSDNVGICNDSTLIRTLNCIEYFSHDFIKVIFSFYHILFDFLNDFFRTERRQISRSGYEQLYRYADRRERVIDYFSERAIE